MNFFNSMKEKIFGSTEGPEPPQRYHPEQTDINDYQQYSAFDDQNRADFGFRVFSNPLEMHRYFERQMNEVFRSFGMTERDGPFFGGNDSFFGSDFGPKLPAIDDEPQRDTLRDHYLRPGFDEPRENYRGDKVIDGHIDIGELDTVIKREEGNKEKQMIPKFKSHFFGQTMSSKTVVAPDGTTEIHRTMRDSQGNEETTTTKKVGHKEYTITTKTDRSGKKEINENIVNMDENEFEAFKNRLPENQNPLPFIDNSDKSIFDQIFGSKM